MDSSCASSAAIGSTPDRVALAQQALNNLHYRALPKVVGPCLDAKPQYPGLLASLYVDYRVAIHAHRVNDAAYPVGEPKFMACQYITAVLIECADDRLRRLVNIVDSRSLPPSESPS